MEDVAIYETKYKFTGSEKDLELHILDNIDRIAESCGWGRIARIERQFLIPIKGSKVIADIMIWHADGSGTVIEVKNTTTNRGALLSAIGQVLFYGMTMEKKLSNVPRMVVAVPEMEAELSDTIKRFSLPVELLMIDGDKCIYLK